VAGDALLPMLAALVVGAAAVGLLVAPRLATAPASPAIAVPLAAALVLVLAANLAVAADLAGLVGVGRTHGALGAAGLALAVALATAADRWWRLAAPIGAVVVLAPLALVVASVGAPWSVWTDVASRPALTFAPSSAWVTHGRALADGTRLTFEEPHRVVAASPATWRVTEHARARTVVREWRLGAGDALTVRPGDELAVEPGARVRFEAGRRVPGAPRSGATWAGAGRAAFVATLVPLAGAAVTLLLGGAAFVAAAPAAGAVTALAPTLVLAFVLGATLWGLYGIALSPELVLVPGALAPVMEVVLRVQAPSWRAALLGVVLTGLVVLFLGAVLAWRARLRAALDDAAAAVGRAPSRLAAGAATAALVAVAAVVAVRGPEPWRLFTWGLALAAAGVIAPRLACAGPRGELAGMAAGTAVVAALVFGEGRLAGIPPGLGEHPALVAAPAAWLTARIARNAS
jgi:hypothetical protein